MNYCKIFKQLKDEGVNHLFNDLNRRLVLGISAGDTTPKPVDSIKDEFPGMLYRYSELKQLADVDIDMCIDFISKHISNSTTYRHHVIDMQSSYDTIIEYFVLSGGDRPVSDPASNTLIITTPRHEGKLENVIYAVMFIYEDHPSVGEDTIGKIVKHELTHVLLELMEFVMDTPIWNDPITDEELFESKEERLAFEEFLCDYIQWDSTAGPNEDPVDKFRDVAKTYLTWIASDLYEPYLSAIEEYYKDYHDNMNGGEGINEKEERPDILQDMDSK